MHTKKGFIENDDFDRREAVGAVVDKRKFIIDIFLKDFSLTDTVNDEDD